MSAAICFVADLSSIRKDSEGRFCLNDLHKAAGGEDRHAPNRYLRSEAADGLIRELGAAYQNTIKQTSQNWAVSPVASTMGRYGGTYVVKELVYAYAMWVSPAFHLKVIRFFDRGVTQGAEVPPFPSSSSTPRTSAW